jgi:hypothetical protein
MTTIERSTRWTSASVAQSAGGIATTAPTQRAKPRWRWSGDDDTFDCRWSDEPGCRWNGADHDDRAMTPEEVESRKFYEQHAKNDWVDNDATDEFDADDSELDSHAHTDAVIPRHKCRGGEEPIDYYRGDEDRDHDDDQHVPYMNLTPDERCNMSGNFKFGMCAHCDAGLDDKSEFVCEPRWQSTVLVCNACHTYYQRLAYLRVVDDESYGGCN